MGYMLRGFVERTTAALFCALFDLWEWLVGIVDVNLRGRHQVILRDSAADGATALPGRRIAIVAMYPTSDSIPFTCNLFDALRANGFSILALSTRMLDSAPRAEVLRRVDRLIERPPVGRDFGSYRLGLKLLGLLDADAPDIERLVLANDSMFYRADTAALVRDIMASRHDVTAMFENYQRHYHAQSFFLAFNRTALQARQFRRFWKRYRPYSSRKHAVNRGEVGLSKAMRKSGVSIGAHFNSYHVRALLEQAADKGLKEELPELLPVADDYNLGSLFGGLQELATAPAGQWSIEALNRLFRRQMIRDLVHRTEIHNPTHVLGLVLNRFSNAPLKRDVCYRGVFDIAQVMAKITGIEPDCRRLVEDDLRNRGLAVSLTRLHRLLLRSGRI